MWLQLFVIFLGLTGLCFVKNQSDETRRKYTIFIVVILILQSGLRNVAVGADTYEYSRRFDYYSTLSWSSLWQNFIDVYIHGGEGREVGYDILNKAVSYITPDFQIFLLLVAVFFFTILGKFIYKNTTTAFEVFMALCFYELFFYTFFSITGIRQTIAVGFTLWSYEYIKAHRIIPFLVLVFLGSTMHMTALIFLPFYFLYRLNLGRMVIVYSFILLPILMVVARPFAGLLAEIAGGYSEYANSTYADAGGPNYLIMLLALAVASYARFNQISHLNHGLYRPYIVALAVTIVLAPLVWVDPSLLRLGYYYNIFLIGLFPAILKCFYRSDGDKSKQLVSFFIVAFVCFMIIRTNSSYAFFWQDMRLPDHYFR